MGKNAHPPRAPKPKSKPESSTDGTGKPSGSTDKKSTKSGNKTTAQTTAQAPAQDAKPAPAKPTDARSLVGGASWTGKLPVNLLHEHISRQPGWLKPEYSMMRKNDAFSSMVTLSAKDAKTQEVTTLPPFKLPLSHVELAKQPTAVEARNFAATYALFRISSMKNLHMTLPPRFRDYWKQFKELKEEDVRNDLGWMYAADPFLVLKEREEARAKRIQAADQAAAAAAKAGKAGGSNGKGRENGPSITKAKAWTSVPSVQIGSKLRWEVNSVLRAHTIWNARGKRLPKPEAGAAIDWLASCGFRKSHAEEAVEHCQDREEALEWLSVYVPEDDLPSWCLPENYSPGLVLASTDLKREAAVRRLASAGYSTEICAEMLDKSHGKELAALQQLQDALIEANSSQSSSGDAGESVSDFWDEELGVLQSIYGDRCEIANRMISIHLDARPDTQQVTVTFAKPALPYPSFVPLMMLKANLPAHIRLSVTRRALQHAQQELLGDQMIFQMIDWLETSIPNLVASPGKLSDISLERTPATKTSASNGDFANKRHRGLASRKKESYLDATSLIKDLGARRNSQEGQKMVKARQSLPAWLKQSDIVETVRNHQVTVIVGDTGSGKSTQAIQYILDDLIASGKGESARMMCTQPRRISALGLADRVSQERCAKVGTEVGYAIRGESKFKEGVTKITFATTGVLLRRLQTEPDGIEESHIFIDEVHERSLDQDFLMAILKQLAAKRPDLKLVLMSASMDPELFKRYFGKSGQVGLVEIAGRTFPVQDHYLEDVLEYSGFSDGSQDIGRTIQSLGMGINYDLIASLVRTLHEDPHTGSGAVLIFMPGTAEIYRCLDKLNNIRDLHTMPLHASLPPADQKKVFLEPPGRKRKIIVSTNVAETSITIPDVIAVVDTGRKREPTFDAQSSITRLDEGWISKAESMQRRGRAGRVRAGQCFKLFTKNVELRMPERPEPEILRTSLAQLCLSVKTVPGVDRIGDFLSTTITPPESSAVDSALSKLEAIGALEGNNLTALGRHMATIPADLKCAKLLVYGTLFGCIDACTITAAVMSSKSPFVSPQDKRDEARSARAKFAPNCGDSISDLRAFRKWDEIRHQQSTRETRAWCEENFLSLPALNEVSAARNQFSSMLKEIGLVPLDGESLPAMHRALHQNEECLPLIQALILSALQPQVLRILYPSQRYASTASGAIAVDPEAKEIKYFDSNNTRTFVHPSSTLFSAQNFYSGTSASFMSFVHRVETSKIFARDLCPSNVFSNLMFGGKIQLDTSGRGLTINNMRVSCWLRIGVMASRLRAILDDILQNRFENPGQQFSSGGDEQQAVVDLVCRLVEFDGMDR